MKAALCKSLVLPLLLAGTHAAAQESPDCRVAAEAADGRVGNAGCLIVRAGRTLLIDHNPSRKLGFPGGTANEGESAQCTAHRETWEETGLDVEVGVFLKRLSTGFALYACASDVTVLSTSDVPPVAPWSRNEVAALVWRDIDDIEEEQWRFPEQLEEVAGLDDE